MGHRLPTILSKAIDDTIRTLNEQSSEPLINDLIACIERMEVLMSDLSGNEKLRPIIDDGEGDIPLWNKEIIKYFQGMQPILFERILWVSLLLSLREKFHERTLAICRSLQISTSARML